MATILIAGCGYVGSRLAEALVRDGARVVGLRRDVSRLPKGVEACAADLGEPSTLTALPAGIEAVVYSAGPGASDEAAYRRAYVEGLGHLLEALAATGSRPERLLFTSSTAVYGQDDGSQVDEDSPTQPRRFSGRVLLEAEALLAASSLRGVILRLGGIYGPGRTRLVEQVRSGRARRHRGAPHFTNRIHRDDAAGALRHLLGVRELAPRYLGVDEESTEEGELLCWLAEALGVPAPPFASSEEPGPQRRAGSKRCSSARLLSSGYRFRYPTFRDGYAELLRA